LYTIGLDIIALSSLFQLKRGRRKKNQTHPTVPPGHQYILGRMITARVSSLLTAPAFVGCVEEGAEEEEESKREAVYMPWQPQKNYP